MKIVELKAENIKNLKVVEIRPDGAVILEGKNGAGKSAVLDSIFMALTGKKIEEPIRNGEARAEINVDLGDYKVRKIFTGKGERLEVLSKEGDVKLSPQTFLNNLLGNLTFDPLAFSSMEGKKQRALLAQLVGLDFVALNNEYATLYNERTIKNREIKGGDPTSYRPSPNQPLPLEALVGGMEKPAEGTPRQEISMADELAKVQALEDQNRQYAEYERKIKSYKEIVESCVEQIRTLEMDVAEHMEIPGTRDWLRDCEDQIEVKIKTWRKDIETTKADIEATEKACASVPVPVNYPEEVIAEAKRSLLTVEETNKQIRKAREFDKALATLEAAKHEVKDLECRMVKIELEKQEKTAAAKFPIAGLGLNDEMVTYQDKPFSQLSTGEQIRISTAVAMALNPKLKVILVREGSLLDKNGLQAIIEVAKEKDYQLWIERVADDKQVGIYLEDGEVKA